MTDPFTTIEPGAASSVSEPPVEISIILPAYQEEEGILPLLERIEEVMEELGRPGRCSSSTTALRTRRPPGRAKQGHR